MTDPTKNQSLRRRLAFALAGFAHAVRAERSVRTQLAILVLVVAGLGYLQPPAVWWALVSLGAAGVIGAELFNTALERLADHLHPDLHPQIRIVKDCAAAAVLCVALGAIGVAIALAVELAAHWR
ncbi:MAG TPA: diacylglycerol kinase [Steroidobacteraceae bacterium]|nr:diacylglycerol kinase [Steroidobacteraceae bacterium]